MEEDAVRLWHCDIVGDEAYFSAFWNILDHAEQQHADSISQQKIRLNYVEIHARLRLLLAEVVSAKPAQLRILKAEHGKPYLPDYPELVFNLSHTANKLAVAYGYHHDIGVDIETCKPRKNLAALVEKCFAEEEQHYWQHLPEPEQIHAFYRFWVRKEAFVKAVGRGIALGLERCVINPQNDNSFLRIPEGYGKADEWFIQAFQPNEKICGALVTKRKLALTTA